MAQSPLYACDDDMLAVFDLVERGIDVSYARMGNHDAPKTESFPRGRDLPGIGYEMEDSSVRSVSWLVTRREQPIITRRVELVKGGVRYAVDQLANENTIEVTPGGRLTDSVVLSGRIATVSDTPDASALMRAFRGALRKSFERVGAYWVGPAAARALDSGGRLTIATQSPPEFNLVRG